jgi:hypothetical protein
VQFEHFRQRLDRGGEGVEPLRFMTALYRAGDYRAALGRPFDELEREWRAGLERVKG